MAKRKGEGRGASYVKKGTVEGTLVGACLPTPLGHHLPVPVKLHHQITLHTS